jgi:hypothetical protein
MRRYAQLRHLAVRAEIIDSRKNGRHRGFLGDHPMLRADRVCVE